MIKRKVVSAFFEVSIVMLVVLLLQAGVFYVIFSQIDVLQMIETSTYSYYANSLSQSAYRLEKNMVNKWASKNAIDTFMDILERQYWRSKLNNEKLKITKSSANNLVRLVKNVDASGCFILINDEMLEGKGEDQVYFIRDAKVQFTNKNNSDITLELGDYKWVTELGLTLGINWSPNFSEGEYQAIDKIKEDLLNKYRTVDNKTSSRLAYWTSRQDLLNTGEKNFVYIYPIIDKYSKKIYGILGIEVREERIMDIVESSYLNSEYASGFAIVKNSDSDQNNASKVDIQAYFGDHIELVSKSETLSYEKAVNRYFDKGDEAKESLFYVLDKQDKNQRTVYGIENKLTIYNKDSYHQNDNWRLILLLDERNLHYNSIGYRRGMNITIVISIITAIILTFIVANLLTKPVKSLVREIEEMDTHEQIKFSETGIKEINLLKDKIEELSSDVANTYLQMQSLLEIIGHGIVIFEENPTAKTYNRTGRMSILLQDPDPSEKAIKKYSEDDYNEMMERRLSDYHISFVGLEQIDDETKIIKFTPKKTSEESSFFVKYVRKIVDSRVFHVYTEYTEEYLEMVNLEYEKNHDSLTDLLNRSYFKRCVEERLNLHPEQKAAMVMWDLDNLKFINDMYGHDWGDQYLRDTASIISLLNMERAYVSRFAGDEFFVFLNYNEDRAEVRKKVIEIQEKLLATKLIISDSEMVKIRASVGICWYPEDGKTYNELYKYADFAMYGAKHSDKGSINEFDKALYEKEYIILSAKEELNKIIEKKLVDYAFQPIVCTRTAEIYGFEALMRPKSKILESVSDVMTVAKPQFKLAQIEQLTFECVLDIMDNCTDILEDKKVFINSIASKTLPQESEKHIKQRLKKYGDRIVIEITEDEEINDNSMAVKQGYKNDYACMIAIDDFGSGYSSDKTLLKIRPDIIKIDMHLIRNIHIDEEKQQRVAYLIEYSRLIDAMTIAEGIESSEELDYLISMGVDYVQGFYICRPRFEIGDISDDKKTEILALNEKWRS